MHVIMLYLSFSYYKPHIVHTEHMFYIITIREIQKKNVEITERIIKIQEKYVGTIASISICKAVYGLLGLEKQGVSTLYYALHA